MKNDISNDIIIADGEQVPATVVTVRLVVFVVEVIVKVLILVSSVYVDTINPFGWWCYVNTYVPPSS